MRWKYRFAGKERRLVLEGRFAPRGAAADADGDAGLIPLVRADLVRPGRGRGPEVEQFLRRCGVQDVAEADFLRTVLARHYGPGAKPPGADQHLRHVRRLVAHHMETGDVSVFAGVAFLRAEGTEGHHKADAIFLGEPYIHAGLDRIYGGRVAGRLRLPLWSGYARIGRQKELRAMLGAAGVEAALTVDTTSPTDNPRWAQLAAGLGGTRITSGGVSDDYRIAQLAAMLALRDADVSRMVWTAVTAAGPHVMHARWSPNARHDPRIVPSQLAAVLAEAEWLPDRNGVFRRPRALTAAELASGFPIQSASSWLQAVGFGGDQRERSEQGQARRRAAETIGLPGDLADRLGALTPEARAALAGEMMQRIEAGAFRPALAFPEREAPSPARRAERVPERARTAPAKAYEVRERSVRISDTDVRPTARAFLRDQYTNDAGQMVCQGCQREMPFRLDDGGYYFEAVAMVRSPPVELAEVHLALCPTCAAKWQHARGTDDAELVAAVLAAAEPTVAATLARGPATVRFTAVHLEDLRHALQEVLGAAASTA